MTAGERERGASRWRVVLACLLAPAGAVQADAVQAHDPQAVAPPLLLAGIRVVDVAAGRIDGPHDVLISAGQIAAIGRVGALVRPADSRRIDGRGLYLLPGLIDLHVHLFNNASRRPPNHWALPLFVAHGVTGVREMAAAGTDLPTVRQWRVEVAQGRLLAPRIHAAGVPVQGATPAEAARQVHAAAAAGADFIKVFSAVPDRQWRRILAAAQTRGLPVAGHVPASLAVLDAARSGLRSNEHLMQVFEACTPQEADWLASRGRADITDAAALRDAQESSVLASFDRKRCALQMRALAATGQMQVPTLALFAAEFRMAAPYASDPRWGWLRADEQARWLRIQEVLQASPPAEQALLRQRWPVARRIVGAMRRAGVPVLAGTDTPMPGVYPGDALHTELALLVHSGWSPAAALRAATLEAARFLGVADRFGRVAAGWEADLVLLKGNPLHRIGNTRRIHAVILAGHWLDRARLDGMLRPALPGSP